MNRDLDQKLIAWKESKGRKPLLLRGARQVGKTWLMKDFGRRAFIKTVYVSFDTADDIREAFEGNLDVPRILSLLELKYGTKIDPKDTLLIFDEVQESPRALTSLKYFCETDPEQAVIAAGSLLGVALHPGTSFPVGKVDMLDLYPMTFIEFLEARGQRQYAELVRTGDWSSITAMRGTLVDALRCYYVVGGMPEAVASFVEQGDLATVRGIQTRILDAYEQDFSKHVPALHAPRVRMVWNSIPRQLARENRKFLYGSVRESGRAKDFELAIRWLRDCGLVTLVPRVAKPGMPLAAYREDAFKMFMLDVGLLGAKGNLDPRSVLDGNRIFEEFKGALAEQYVLQQLVSDCGIEPSYWSAENSTGEVDFVYQQGADVIPLEVKAEENLRARSLHCYCEKYRPPYAVRTSMSDYREQPVAGTVPYTLFNVPLYAVSRLPTVHS